MKNNGNVAFWNTSNFGLDFDDVIQSIAYLWDAQFRHLYSWVRHWFLQKCCNIVLLFVDMVEKVLKHIHLLILVLFSNFVWSKRFVHWLLITIILWITIVFCLGFWIAYNLTNFICSDNHMFHHISILISWTIQCLIKKDIYENHYLKYHLQSCHFCVAYRWH